MVDRLMIFMVGGRVVSVSYDWWSVIEVVIGACRWSMLGVVCGRWFCTASGTLGEFRISQCNLSKFSFSI